MAGHSDTGKRPVDRPRVRLWRWLAILLLLALIVDFLVYRNTVANAPPLAGEARADGIVVLTGGSGLRIRAGLALLSEGRAERMLISGVNAAISAEEVAARTGGATELFACCVDTGYTARTTRGNAEEAAAWASARGYGSLIIVTSDYHMPRSMMLMRQEAEGIELIAAPVRTRIDPERALTDFSSLRGVVTEWAKWRVTGLTAAIR